MRISLTNRSSFFNPSRSSSLPLWHITVSHVDPTGMGDLSIATYWSDSFPSSIRGATTASPPTANSTFVQLGETTQTTQASLRASWITLSQFLSNLCRLFGALKPRIAGEINFIAILVHGRLSGLKCDPFLPLMRFSLDFI